MTSEPQGLRDPIDCEREDPVLTAALLRALSGYGADTDHRVDADDHAYTDDRTDPDDDGAAFAAGVRARLAGPRPPAAPDGPQLSAGLRRVAALLPPLMLPKGLAQLGAGAGLVGKGAGVAGKGAGLGWTLALPAVTVVALLLSVVQVVSALVAPPSRGPQREDRIQAGRELADWWRARRSSSVVVLVGLGALFWLVPGEVLTLVLLISCLVLCALFARLGAAGLATRREIGDRAGFLLLNFVCWTHMAWTPQMLAPGGLEGSGWVALILGIGGLACLALAHARALWSSRWRWAILVGGGLILALLTQIGQRVGKQQRRPDDLRTWLAAPGPERIHWSLVEDCVGPWRAAGLGPLDLSVLQERVDQGHFKPYEHHHLLQLGLLPDAVRRAGRDPVREQHVFERDGPSFSVGFLGMHLLGALPDGDPDEETRERIAARLVTSLPAPDGLSALEELCLSATLLETLGRPVPDEVFRPVARQALQLNWTTLADGGLGCFAPSPGLLEEARSRGDGEPAGSSAWRSEARPALEAMARWGVPEGIDLLAFERWLARESWAYRSAGLRLPDIQPAILREWLRSLPAWEALQDGRLEDSLLGQAWAWRLVVAAALLTLFAVGATWRAPVEAVVEDA